MDEHFQELTELVKGLAVLGELTPRSIDAISSFGERLSSLIVTKFFKHCGLSAVHLDARKVIVTDHRHTQAAPDLNESYARLAAAIPPLVENHVVVMGGFIAATPEGITTTLGRGGSDFTASIVGAGIGAEEIQIWTDVDGMLTADPNVVPNAASREDHLVRRSRGAGVFRREGAASVDRAPGDRPQHSGIDPELAATARGWDAHRGRNGSHYQSGEVHRLQVQSDCAEHSRDAHVPGLRIHADAFSKFSTATRLRWTWSRLRK